MKTKFFVMVACVVGLITFSPAPVFGQKAEKYSAVSAAQSLGPTAALQDGPRELTDEEMANTSGEFAPAVIVAARLAGYTAEAYYRLYSYWSRIARMDQLIHAAHGHGWGTVHWHFPWPYVEYHHK